jgi:hypothetical protein
MNTRPYNRPPIAPPDWLPPSMSERPARGGAAWKALAAAMEKLDRVRVQAAQRKHSRQ